MVGGHVSWQINVKYFLSSSLLRMYFITIPKQEKAMCLQMLITVLLQK